MTTIAYRDEVLAADRQIQCGHLIVGGERKALRRGRLLYAFTGSSALGDGFETWLLGGMSGEPPSLKGPASDGSLDASAVLFPGGDLVVWFVPGAGPTKFRTPYFAIGIGQEVAMGTMAHGASAAEAVMIANRLISGSGGGVDVVTRPRP